MTSFCKKCKSNKNKEKKILISKLPNYLIIHFDRIHDNYEEGGKYEEKVNDRIEFNDEINLIV